MTHPQLSASIPILLGSHGRALRTWGRPEEAERRLGDALERATGAFGADHPLTLTLSSDLGTVLAKLGRLDEGLRRTEESLRALQERVDPADPSRLSAVANYAGVLIGAGRGGEALQLLEVAQAPAARAFPSGHPLREVLARLLREARSARAPTS